MRVLKNRPGPCCEGLIFASNASEMYNGYCGSLWSCVNTHKRSGTTGGRSATAAPRQRGEAAWTPLLFFHAAVERNAGTSPRRGFMCRAAGNSTLIVGLPAVVS